jgi:eukaryotic-like serine/threonine-protein kinase
MGVVYEAIDREHDGRIAIKTFRPIARDAVLRLKQEFRALRDVHHPNLIRLGELVEDRGQWFFTMELIDGLDFVRHVRRGSAANVSASLARAATVDLVSGPPVIVKGMSAFGSLDEGKLRTALPQLVAGLDALHSAGKVHRDIKPSNVLVTREERVVILDFGLAHDMSRGDETRSGRVVGTIAYMAPEQGAGKSVDAAGDWYAVGVLLYEALTGKLPFEGPAMKVLAEKQKRAPAPPSKIAAGVSPDLDALCIDLLQPLPDARPTGGEILDRLRVRRARRRARTSPDHLFVGRDAQLADLSTAFDQAALRSVVALVHGESGVGKSLLVRQFTEKIAESRAEVLALHGRCYERESVPYKAFDGIIDDLTRFLATLDRDELDDLLPDSIARAAQLFPVLRSIDLIARTSRPEDVLDPQQQRALLFAAVRELFVALARRYRLILTVDDLQWTDSESLALMRELLRAPAAPPILYLATLRATEVAPVAIADIEKAVALAGNVHEVVLGALSTAAGEELVAKLVAQLGVRSPVAARAIVDEARGHPLFIQELLHHIPDTSAAPAATHLDEAIMSRVGRLPSEQRSMLEIVTVAGRPLPQSTIARAADLDFGVFAAHVDELRAANLIRSSGTRRSDAVESYHDRIRLAVLAQLTAAERRAIHRQLAIALEAGLHADPETLALHWREAGAPERAVSYVLLAAEQAVVAVAFGRAARLYRMAIELGIPSADDRRRIAVLLADALAHDGQSAAAAEAYLAAVAEHPDQRRLLTQRAAEQLLRAGHINEGIAHVRTVLADMGMWLPKRPRGALLSLLYQRAAVRLRGLRYKERSADDIQPDQLERIDACWAVALLGFVDTLRGADFGARHLRLALAAGEPRRLARALAVEAVYAVNIAHGYEPRAHELLAMARQLADKSESAYADAFVLGASSVVEHALGNFREARDKAERAERRFRQSCTGVAWELDLTQLIALMCLLYEGKLLEMERRIAPILEEAQARGDLFCVSSVQVIIKFRTHLFRGQPDVARQVATDAMARWDQEGFQLQHRHALLAHAEIDLYLGRGRDAYDRFERSWRALERSLLLEAQQQRLELFDARARAALAAARERDADTRALLAVAERHATRIERDRMPWAAALAALTRAGIAERRGEAETAVTRLHDAVEKLDAAGLELHAAVGRRILGQRLGGHEGDTMRSRADAWLDGAQIEDVDRMTAMIAPGFGAGS